MIINIFKTLKPKTAIAWNVLMTQLNCWIVLITAHNFIIFEALSMSSASEEEGGGGIEYEYRRQKSHR